MSKIIQVNFNDNLLDELASYLVEKYKNKNDFSNIAIVFEGSRPSVYLRKLLSKKVKGVLYPPTCFSINSFMEHIVMQEESFDYVCELEAHYLLYKIIKNMKTLKFNKDLSFSSFMGWAKEILRFIDKGFLENKKDEDLKISEASVSIGYDVPKEIKELLEHVLQIKEIFIKQLKEQNKYTRGMMYSKAGGASENIKLNEFSEIIFCNNLFYQKTQAKVLTNIAKQIETTFFYQGDPSEWDILKEIYAILDCPIEKKTKEKSKTNIEIFQAKDEHSQFSMLRDVVNEIEDKNNVLVVLPDQSNMVPLFTMLSAVTEDINMTMGYPLKRSAFYSFIESIIDSQKTKKKDRYYSKDYLKTLKSPFVKHLFFEDTKKTQVLIKAIVNMFEGLLDSSYSGMSFVDIRTMQKSDEVLTLCKNSLENKGYSLTKGEITQALETLHSYLFFEWEKLSSLKELSEQLEKLIKNIVLMNKTDEYPLQFNVIDGLYSVIEQIRQSNIGEIFLHAEVFDIFKKMFESQKTKFAGRPLQGIQVSEMMETRCLCFDNVIITDLNEGVIPYVNIYEPLIPREVMKMIGITSPEIE